MLLTAVREDATGDAELDGVTHRVDLSLVADPEPGDYVIVHAGFAIEKLDTHEADERIALFQALAASAPRMADPS